MHAMCMETDQVCNCRLDKSQQATDSERASASERTPPAASQLPTAEVRFSCKVLAVIPTRVHSCCDKMHSTNMRFAPCYHVHKPTVQQIFCPEPCASCCSATALKPAVPAFYNAKIYTYRVCCCTLHAHAHELGNPKAGLCPDCHNLAFLCQSKNGCQGARWHGNK